MIMIIYINNKIYIYKMNKYIIVSLLLISDCISYSTIPKPTMNLRVRKNIVTIKAKIERRDVFRIARVITIPYVFNNYANIANAAKKEEKNIETLREEANRIIEIIEVQKDSFNLPIVSNIASNKIITEEKRKISDNNWATIKEAKNISEKEEIKNTLDIILNDFKKNGKDKPEETLKTLQSYCSDSNVIKSKDVVKLKQLFADGKYGIFLGKFDNYYITNYNKIYDTDVEKTYYEVDVKLEAPYNIMIYNSIQFDEMYYPENSGEPCYIIYRWIFVKTNDKYMIDGCYLIHK
jgi:hypothetical protein